MSNLGILGTNNQPPRQKKQWTPDMPGFDYRKAAKGIHWDKIQATEPGGRIKETPETKMLFDISKSSLDKANKNLAGAKKDIFDKFANKYGLDTNAYDENGTARVGAVLKSPESMATRLMRNHFRGGSIHPNGVRDQIRGIYVFQPNQVNSLNDVIKDLQPWMKKLNVVKKPGYFGLSTNLEYNGTPMEIQFHTPQSWKNHLDTDVIEKKWRGKDKSTFTPQEKQDYINDMVAIHKLKKKYYADKDLLAMKDIIRNAQKNYDNRNAALYLAGLKKK